MLIKQYLVVYTVIREMALLYVSICAGMGVSAACMIGAGDRLFHASSVLLDWIFYLACPAVGSLAVGLLQGLYCRRHPILWSFVGFAGALTAIGIPLFNDVCDGNYLGPIFPYLLVSSGFSVVGFIIARLISMAWATRSGRLPLAQTPIPIDLSIMWIITGIVGALAGNEAWAMVFRGASESGLVKICSALIALVVFAACMRFFLASQRDQPDLP